MNYLEFLALFHRPDETVFIRFLDDPKIIPPEQKWQQKYKYKLCDLWGQHDFLAKMNMERKGVFFTVNGGGHYDADVTEVKAHYVDIDMDKAGYTKDKAGMMQDIESFALPPSLIVETNKGYHVYWLISGGDVSRFTGIQKKLIAHFDSDIAIHNEARILRLPGFYHHKGDPFLISIKTHNPEARYTQDQLEAVLGETTALTYKGVHLPQIMTEGIRNSGMTSWTGYFYSLGFDGEELKAKVYEINEKQCIPPLELEEVDAIIASVTRLYEKGVPVPKVETVAGIAVPEYTLQDFQNIAPFEFLASLAKNSFIQDQVYKQLKAKSEEVGYKGFASAWKAFKSEVSKASLVNVPDDTIVVGDADMVLRSGNYRLTDRGSIVRALPSGEVVEVCPHPIAPIARLVDIDTKVERLNVTFKKGNYWRSAVADKSVFASGNAIKGMADYGMVVTDENSKALSKYIMDVEQLNYEELQEIRSTRRMGWLSQGSRYEGLIPYVGGIEFGGNGVHQKTYEVIKPSGEFELWRQAMLEIRSHDENVVPRIFLAASFASVLIEPLGMLPFFVHFWGPSGVGKSVMLMVAASVWANPGTSKGFVNSFNSTDVGMEMMAGFLNSLPLCLDELQMKNSKRVKDFQQVIYQLTEGRGRLRGAKNGGIRDTLTWRNCILSNGETPITTESDGSGAINRVLEIAGHSAVHPDLPNVCAVIEKNYGHAGKLFVDWLMTGNGIEVVKELKGMYRSQLEMFDNPSKQAESAALILAADKVITDMFFADGKCLTCVDIQACMAVESEEGTRDSGDGSNGVEIDVNVRAHRFILDFIARHPAKFEAEPLMQGGEIYGRKVKGDDGAEYVAIIPSVLREILRDEGFNLRSYTAWAIRKKQVLIDAKGRSSRPTRLGLDQKITRCVWVKSDVIE